MTQGSNHPETRTTEGETRKEILNLLLEHNRLSASELSSLLNLKVTGIRRHLDNLESEGLVAEAPAPRSGTRTRGRPAKSFQLTDAGRATFGHSYDGLAALALATLRETGGDEAVKAFAKKRAETIVAGVDSPSAEDSESLTQAAEAVAVAFSKAGYAATMNAAGNNVQICQHHCPIAGVAAQFPELCEAEHEAIAELLGHHIQPLASIADGHGVCTTNIPITPIRHVDGTS